jgi:hypothetical protein
MKCAPIWKSFCPPNSSFACKCVAKRYIESVVSSPVGAVCAAAVANLAHATDDGEMNGRKAVSIVWKVYCTGELGCRTCWYNDRSLLKNSTVG